MTQLRFPGYEPSANEVLSENHYLGPTQTGRVYRDEHGIVVVGAPTSRRLPTSWAELQRWCIVSDTDSAGSRQWRSLLAWVRSEMPAATTLVSYSDPSVGHTGALYRACNWLWAPTWHRLRPPPSGHGDWGTGLQSVKDRWVFPLMRDPLREDALAIQDESVSRRFPGASYREPRWKRGKPVLSSGGGDFKRWGAQLAPGSALR